MKAIILAAGKGGNLAPFSNTRPIPMVNVAGTYLLDNTISLLEKSGVSDIFVVVGHHKEKVIERIGEHTSNGANIHFVEQKKIGEIGNAVSQMRSKILPGEYFLLIYGDTVTSANIFSKIQQSFHSFKSPVASICLPPSNEMFGNVFLNAQMKITDIIEKPKGDQLGNYVLAGVYILPYEFFDILENNKKSMEKAIKEMVVKKSLRASMWEEDWLDIVYPWEILTANRILMDAWDESRIARTADLEGNVTIQGTVRIAEGVVVKAGAVLEGPCSIGRNCYIGNNTLVRSYTSIGDHCSVGYGVELKNCVVFKNTRIGRLSFIGDSVLGEDVDIGAGTMTVNRTVDWKPVQVRQGSKKIQTERSKLGAFVGDNVIIGAGNTIEPGTVVGPKKIVSACYSVSGGR
tara:strand:+ start:133 stop:1341 length:1209 start_codon:yes stop_codon:yes gene_type:complete